MKWADRSIDRRQGRAIPETDRAAGCLRLVIRRHVLAAIGAGVAAGDDDQARAALAKVDWVLRGHARRRLEAALIEAALATGSVNGDDPQLVLRAAALIVRGQRDCDLASPDAIAAAYARAAIAPPPRLPVATILAAVVAGAFVLALGGFVVQTVTTPGPTGAYHRPTPPAAIGAFRDGGVPQREPAIEAVLAGELPDLVASSYAVTGHALMHETERQRQLAALRDNPAFASHGAPLASAWHGLIDGLDAWMELEAGAGASRTVAAELRAHIDAVSDQLAAAGFGYYLDPELGDRGHRRVGIFTYRVDDVAFVRAARERVRVLGLRRLDHLDAALPALGMKTEELGDPVVLLDQIDDKVTSQIVPVLAGIPYDLGDPMFSRGRGRAASAAASAAIRRELAIALGSDIEDLARATARIRQLVTASVRHHEAQHGLDEDSGLAYPAALAGYLHQDATSAFAIRARFELSAYVSQIAADVWLPQLALWNLARHALRDARPHSEEAYVAVVVIEGLARQLHLDVRPGVILHDGLIDRDRLGALIAPIAALSTAELRSTAAALWAELFDGKLARIVDI